MKILQVNKFLYRRAGAEAYMLDLAELLTSHGHEVALWGMRPPHPHPLPQGEREKKEIPLPAGERIKVRGEFLLDPIDYDKREGLGRDLKKFGHMVWSLEAAKKFEQVLKQFKPDIIHIHNIYHHISPSILTVARRHKIPVVQTLHDFKWICPNYKLFTQGAICQRCKRYRYWNAVRYKCLQGSCMASGVVALEMWTHRVLQIYEKGVARFITPSNFLRELLIGWGKNEKKIVHLPNFVPIASKSDFDSSRSPTSSENYILFAGRLAEEKGIWLLLEIAKALPEIKFKIAGTGPEEKKLKHQILSVQNTPHPRPLPQGERENEGKIKNIELLGFQEKSALQELIAGARLIIVPSLWYENYPMSVLEAQAVGKAVIASAIGGIPEMIEDEKTGFLVSILSSRAPTLRSGRGDPEQLKNGIASSLAAPRNDILLWIAKIKKIYYDDALLQRVGQAARERVMKENGAEEYYKKMMEIYKEAGAKISNS